MTTNADRAAILTDALRAGLEGDRDTLARLYTDDVTAWTPTLAMSSASELIAELDRRDDAFSEIELDTIPLDVAGDYACVEWRVTMTHTGTLEIESSSLEPTGLEVTINGVTIAEFRGDRICSLRQYWDELSVFEQLGLIDDLSNESD
jgi:ketosteroid isomerase-like protein